MKEKGITLIALIITIIILLILAGVGISLALNGGIIKKTEDAVIEHDKAIKREEEMLEAVSDYIDDVISKMPIEKPEEWGDNPHIGVIQTQEKIKIPLPEGFTQIKSSGNNINDGIVITDGTNEFVWIPCTIEGQGGTIKYEKWTSSLNGDPTADNTVDDDIPQKVTNLWGQTEESQIEKYKGFYISRYEAGIPETMTPAIQNLGSRNVVGTPVSKRNSTPWNYITYTRAKANAELMYEASEYMQCGLLTGTQWDTIVKWLESSEYNVQINSTTWGNYINATITGITEYSNDAGITWTPAANKTGGVVLLLKTGNSEYTKANNIYDMAGNLSEWTNEKYNTNKVIRGR
jgi:hypothetical protein